MLSFLWYPTTGQDLGLFTLFLVFLGCCEIAENVIALRRRRREYSITNSQS